MCHIIQLWGFLMTDFHLLGFFFFVLLQIRFYCWQLICLYSLYLSNVILRYVTCLETYPFLLIYPFYLGMPISMGSRRVGHDWATSLSLFTFMHQRRKWQPTPVFLPGESQELQSLVGCPLWGCTEQDMTEAT